MQPQNLHPTREVERRAIDYLRLSLTDVCDMQCSYCRPCGATQTHSSSVLSLGEIEILTGALGRLGVVKVRITGGEPLLRKDVVEVVRCVAGTPGIRTVGLTTNGTRLAKLSSELHRAGLKSVNVSLDTINRDTFQRITGRDSLDNVLKGIEEALLTDFEKVKINTVVMRGINDTELADIAALAKDCPIDVRFIELMPVGYSTPVWESLYVPASEIIEAIPGMTPLPYDGRVSARTYSVPGSLGTIGIISPMSRDFCDGCSRIRITCDGKLKPCLRLPGEYDIRALLQDPLLDECLQALLGQVSCEKLSEGADVSAIQAQAMSMVGG